MASPSDEDRQRWGLALAQSFRQTPDISNFLGLGGVCTDCTGLSKIPATDKALAAQIDAFSNTIEEGIQHMRKTLESEMAAEKMAAQTLRDELKELQAQFNQLSLKTNTNPGNPNVRRTTNDPEKFAGTEKDIAKRQKEYVNWRSHINRTFAIDDMVFTDDFRRINHIAGLLTGDAFDIHRDNFNKIVEYPLDNTKWPWKTSSEVFKAINAQYETLDLSREAKMKFDELAMKKKPYQNFIAEFNSLASQCGKTEEQKVDALELKVSEELASEASHQIVKPDRDDFAAWSTLYQKIYDSLQESAHVNKLRNKQTTTTYRLPPPTVPSHQPAPSAPAANPDAMQLDALRPRPTHDDCRAYRLCFYCKKPGHTKDNCEEKKTNDARFGKTPSTTGATPTRGAFDSQTRGGYQGGYSGRGGFQNGFQSPQSTPYNTQFNRPQNSFTSQQSWNTQYPRPNPRLRTLGPGFVEGEVESTTPSTPSISESQGYTPSSDSVSGKE